MNVLATLPSNVTEPPQLLYAIQLLGSRKLSGTVAWEAWRAAASAVAVRLWLVEALLALPAALDDEAAAASRAASALPWAVWACWRAVSAAVAR